MSWAWPGDSSRTSDGYTRAEVERMRRGECVTCGTSLPDDAPVTRTYCGPSCSRSHAQTLEREQRDRRDGQGLTAEDRERIELALCLMCGGPKPKGTPAHVNFCSLRCQRRRGRIMDAYIEGRPADDRVCEACGKSLAGRHRHAKACGAGCRATLSKRRKAAARRAARAAAERPHQEELTDE